MGQKLKTPEVGKFLRGIGRLVEVQDLTPPPPPKQYDYIFEETTATVGALVNEKEINEFSTYSDGGESGSCVASAVKSAQGLAAIYEASDVVFVVVKKTELIRHNLSSSMNYSDPDYCNFEYLKTGSRWDLPDQKEEIVWRSDRDS